MWNASCFQYINLVRRRSGRFSWNFCYPEILGVLIERNFHIMLFYVLPIFISNIIGLM